MRGDAVAGADALIVVTPTLSASIDASEPDALAHARGAGGTRW